MTGDEIVTVTLDPPRLVTSRGTSWLLTAESCEEIYLPKSCVALIGSRTIDEMTLPRWIAVDRGLTPVEEHDDQRSQHEQITRHDWYAGLAMLGMLVRGSNTSSIPWDAGKLADRMIEQ